MYKKTKRKKRRRKNEEILKYKYFELQREGASESKKQIHRVTKRDKGERKRETVCCIMLQCKVERKRERER